MFHSKTPEAVAKTGRWISQHDTSISASYSIVKSFIALFQLYAIIDFLTKEKSNDRIKISYASYQLTMIPCGLMSLLNMLCGFLTPSYPAIYMVRNTVMDEAIKRGGVFGGIVGELIEEKIDESKMPIIKFNKPTKSNNRPPPGSLSRETPVARKHSEPDIASEITAFIRHEDFQIRNGTCKPLVVGWFVYLCGVIPLLRLIPSKNILSAFAKPSKKKTAPCSETSAEKNTEIDAEKTTATISTAAATAAITVTAAAVPPLSPSNVPSHLEPQDQIPDRFYRKIFLENINKLKDNHRNKRYHQFILPIGNASRRIRSSLWPSIISDHLIMFGILLPFIVIHILTGGYHVPVGPYKPYHTKILS
jgi:hypothetical protein